MKLQLRRPSKRRAKGVGKALGAVGAFLGSLPATVRPGSRDRSKLLRVLIPASVAGALAAGIAQRRRARASVETWESAEPGDPGHGADSGFDPTAGAAGDSTGTESVESTRVAPSSSATETERRKDEAEGAASREGVSETPRAAGAETTTSAEAGSHEP